MKQITLHRRVEFGKTVKGYLNLDDKDTFGTIENKDYLIPEGSYRVTVTYSPRFKKELPLLLRVPGRSGIRIHFGFKPEHSKGCILLFYEANVEYTTRWIKQNEPVMLTIKNDTKI